MIKACLLASFVTIFGTVMLGWILLEGFTGDPPYVKVFVGEEAVNEIQKGCKQQNADLQ
jgi:hypothetical protein